MVSPVIATELSKNRKIGPASATYVSKATCPSSCALLKADNGVKCYADVGRMALHTKRVTGATESDPIEIAKIEADKIADLSGRLDLRVHVVGDCSDPVSASIVGSAMVQYDNKPNRRGKAWTYTHAWQQVPASSWNGASVLASVDSEDQIQSARDQGYAPAVIVPVFLNGSKPMKVNGTKLIPCKNQIDKSITCVDCRLCFDASKLFDRKLGIAFTPDAGTKKRIG